MTVNCPKCEKPIEVNCIIEKATGSRVTVCSCCKTKFNQRGEDLSKLKDITMSTETV